MSFTTLDHALEDQSNFILASPEALRQLAGVPAGFRLAGMMLLRARRGTIRFDLPDGRRVLFDHGEKGPNAVVEVHSFNFAKRAIAGGDVGFAESYMDQEWSTPDLTSVLEFFSENFEAAGQLAVGGMMVRLSNMIRHVFNRNSKAGSKRNIEAHYDLGNEFYELWLDRSMTYSSALYTDPSASLEQAQEAKYARIADELDLSEGKSVLEIGCGWGGFAEYAAKHRGANVTCLTISPSQRDWALQRMQREGLSEKVEIRLEDYRDHSGQYDGVASIEMFEAVGESYWPSYFSKVAESLKHGARAALQIITIDGQLVALNGRSNNDGRKGEVSAEVEDGDLIIESTKFDGTLPLGIIPSSHWNRLQVYQNQMLSTETGEILDIEVEVIGDDKVEVGDQVIDATHYRLKSDLTVDLWYDRQSRWVKLAFEVRGQDIEYVLNQLY